MNDDIKKLELRITELENQLKSASGAAAVDPEDMKTFQKVSKQLGISGCINECQVSHCISCIVCYTCHVCTTCVLCHCIKCNECICGPCILNHGSGFGGSRFGSLG